LSVDKIITDLFLTTENTEIKKLIVYFFTTEMTEDTAL